MYKKIVSTIMIFILCATVISGTVATAGQTYKIKCSYLKNPDSIIAIADKSAKFWEKAYDKKYGGFFAYLDRTGKVDMSKPYKISMIQYRDAFAFARAYQLTGKKEYLDYARKGLDFLYKHAWDNVNGGWYSEMNRDGSLVAAPIEYVDWNNMKWFGTQFGTIQSISTLYDVTRNKVDEDWLNKSYASLEKHLWDSTSGLEGYYENADKDWGNPNVKSLYSTLDAIITPEMDMYLLNLDKKYKNKITTIADVSIKYIIKSMEKRKFGVNDRFDSKWNAIDPQPSTSSGNYLKSGLYLYMAYLANPKPEYKASAQKLISQVLDTKAYDKVNGGPYASLDPATGIPTDYKKNWWILESGVNSGLVGYYVSKDTKYLKMADESMDFFMKHMYDPKYGDAYGETAADGSKPDTVKGNYWKDAFHTLELFYYTYLYGNLMLNNKPVSLYYNISPDKSARSMSLNPLLMGKNKLLITKVTLNGKEYKNFDSAKRLLKIPAKIGGEFRVTFKPVIVK